MPSWALGAYPCACRPGIRVPGEKLVSRSPSGVEDPAVQLSLQGRPGRALDDEPEKDIVGTGVGEALAGPRHRPLASATRINSRGVH